MKLLVATIAIAVTMVTCTTATAAIVLRLPHKPFNNMTTTQKIGYLKKQIHHDNSLIRWYHNHRELQSVSSTVIVKWAKVSLRISKSSLRKLQSVRAVSGGDMSAWLCIHSKEGAWNDSGAPYWGGLQMDMGFQSSYGLEFLRRWGTADHWPIWAQITAARRARDGFGPYKARGYGPWPKTARLCGLL